MKTLRASHYLACLFATIALILPASASSPGSGTPGDIAVYATTGFPF